jgi:hypothetical protein
MGNICEVGERTNSSVAPINETIPPLRETGNQNVEQKVRVRNEEVESQVVSSSHFPIANKDWLLVTVSGFEAGTRISEEDYFTTWNAAVTYYRDWMTYKVG